MKLAKPSTKVIIFPKSHRACVRRKINSRREIFPKSQDASDEQFVLGPKYFRSPRMQAMKHQFRHEIFPTSQDASDETSFLGTKYFLNPIQDAFEKKHQF